MRLLLVEDDVTIGEGLRDFLRADGHLVDWCTTLAQAKILATEPYDAWLIDWNLPDGSGLAWLKSVRDRGGKVPAVVLTARDRLEERIEGLDSGADDYLVKPFAPQELQARLRAVTRRSSNLVGRESFGPVEIDLDARCAWHTGQSVDLTAREWGVLEALVRRAGRIVSRQELESLVSGPDADLASNVIDVHIFRLRSKLGREAIQTVRGLGFRIPRPAP